MLKNGLNAIRLGNLAVHHLMTIDIEISSYF